jgi:adenosylhomocysteinase
MGARVLVTEVNPFKALQAHMDGYQVLPMEEAAPLGDVFVTVTGNVHVITLEHLRSMKSGAIVCNSGHFDVEIDVNALSLAATKIEDVRPSMQRFTLTSTNGATHHVYILGEGRLVNLAAAEGHPSEVMSLSFCGQALACEYLIQNQKELQAGVHTLPEALDIEIAQLYLTAEGLKIDSLRPDQLAYLQGWQ